jgi:integrase/recombinase XerC
LLGGTLGEANGLVLAYRSHMVGVGRSPATVNRRLSALRSLNALARTLGLVGWSLEVRNVKAESCRDTRGPQLDGQASDGHQGLARRGDDPAALRFGA